MTFADVPTTTLVTLHRNLLAGLDEVVSHLAAGTFHTMPVGKASPPSQAGQLTLVLLQAVDAELEIRKDR